MKLFSILVSGLLVSSQFIVSGGSDSVYYQEFKALKKAPSTKMLFDEDVDGGSHTTQCNLEIYRPLLFAEGDLGFFTLLDQSRRLFSLGNIQRKILMGKELSFFNQLLQFELGGINADLIIVTSETMPALYNYVDSISKKAKISTPVVFISLKEGFFKIFSRKMLMFTGSVVIGQQLLHDLSDEELEAVIAQEIGHIAYNHGNKKFLLQAAAFITFCLTFSNNKDLCSNRLLQWFTIPALSSLFVNKRFEKQVDIFACKKAGKSDGLVKFYKRLQERDQARAAEFDVIYHMIAENAVDIPMLTYIGLNMSYYLAKAEHCIVEAYNKLAYPSHEARIEAAKKYVA